MDLTVKQKRTAKYCTPEKLHANEVVRNSFDSVSGMDGDCVGLLGESDLDYLLSRFSPSSIHMVERDVQVVPYLEGLAYPRGIDLDTNFHQSEIIEWLSTRQDNSISVLWLDMFGYSDIWSSASINPFGRDRNIKMICSKLRTPFHIQLTVEDQRSKKRWEKNAREVGFDNPSDHFFDSCESFLLKRGIKVRDYTVAPYQGAPNRMVTSSFVGIPA